MSSLPTADLLPVGQAAHEDTSAAPTVSEYLPATHAVHSDGETAPEVPEYLPAGQFLHAMLPDPSLYLPAAHIWHIWPILSEPASHTHADTLWLPAAELECVGHVMHSDSAAAPTVLEYLPAAHSVHVDGSVAPAVVEYLPLAQVLHSASPDAPLKVPAAHRVHTPPASREEPALQKHELLPMLPGRESECGGHFRQEAVYGVAPAHVTAIPRPWLPEVQGSVIVPP